MNLGLGMLGGGLVAWSVGLKLHLIRLKSSAPLLESLSYALPDLALALLVVGIAALVDHPHRLHRRLPAALVLGLTAFLFSVCYAVLVRKGSLLDRDLLVFTLAHWKDLGPVLASETTWVQYLLFGVPILFVLAPLVVLLRRGRPVPAPARGRWLWPVALAAAVWGVGAAAAPAHPAHPELAICLLRPLVTAGGSRLESSADFAAGGPLVFPEPEDVFAAWDARAPDAQRPNILFVVMESVRASAVTPYAPDLPSTPFLDELAQTSLVFERAYCVVPHTTKSLISILTGYPPKLRLDLVEVGRLPVLGLPALLARIGYRSAFVQTAIESFEHRRLLVQDLGFDHFVSAEDMDPRLEKHRYLGVEDRGLIEPSLAWLRKERDRPFFLTLLNVMTHHDYAPPASFPRRTFALQDPPPNQGDFQDYLNSILCFDGVLRDLLAELRKEGFLENTVVFLMGDHGEGFGEHGRIGHDDVPWEEGIRIPLLVHGPEVLVGPPRRVGGLRQLLDLVPTVADLVGVAGARELRSPAEGVSLLAEVPPDRRLEVVSWFNSSSVVTVAGDRKSIYYPLFDRIEVFDLGADPLERNDLGRSLGLEEYQRTVREVMAFLSMVNVSYLAAEEGERRRLRKTTAPVVARPLHARIGAEIELLGWTGGDRVGLTSHLDLELAFAVTMGPPDLEIRLRARAGTESFAVTDVRDPNRLPVRAWRAGDYILLPARIHLEVPASGEYVLELALVEAGGSAPVPVTFARGGDPDRGAGGWVELGRITVLPR